MKVLIKDATIIAGDEMSTIDKGYIVIENDKISTVGAGHYSNKTEVEINASEMIITPGFISGHSHTWDAGIKDIGVGEPFDDFLFGHIHCTELIECTSNNKFISGMRDSFLEMLEGGIIAQCEFGCGGANLILKAAKGLPIKLLAFESLCLWAGLGMKDCKFTESELVENKKELSKEDLKEVNKMLDKADGISLNTPNDFTDPALRQLSKLCKTRNKMICAHAAEASWYAETSLRRTGVRDVERIITHCEPDFLVHLVYATDQELDLMAQKGIPIVSCPRSNALTAVGFPPVRKIMERNIILGLGTDNVCMNSQDLFSDMRFLSRMVRGIEQRKKPDFPEPRQILKMATINGAKILHLEKELGSIKEGKKASLIFVDGTDRNLRPVVAPINTLVHRARPSNVKAVMIEGRLIIKKAWDREIKGERDKILQHFEDL